MITRIRWFKLQPNSCLSGMEFHYIWVLVLIKDKIKYCACSRSNAMLVYLHFWAVCFHLNTFTAQQFFLI